MEVCKLYGAETCYVYKLNNSYVTHIFYNIVVWQDAYFILYSGRYNTVFSNNRKQIFISFCTFASLGQREYTKSQG